MRKKLKLMLAPMVGSGGVWGQAVGFVLFRSAGSRREDIFTFNLLSKEIL
jgi:hypothetical protein